jgi:hypothetical protein
VGEVEGKNNRPRGKGQLQSFSGNWEGKADTAADAPNVLDSVLCPELWPTSLACITGWVMNSNFPLEL